MIVRLMTSLNWVVGVVCVAVAVAYPFYWDVTVDGAKTEAVRVIQEIARAEQSLAEANRGRLLYFGLNQADLMQRELRLKSSTVSGNFSYEAYADGANALVLRAITSEAALKAGRLPPLMYVVKARTSKDLPQENEAIEGDWFKLSGKKIGLLGLVGDL